LTSPNSVTLIFTSYLTQLLEGKAFQNKTYVISYKGTIKKVNVCVCVCVCVDVNKWLRAPFPETQKVRWRGRIPGDNRIDWILSEFSSLLAGPTCSFCPHFSHPSLTEEWRQSST